MAKLRHPVRYAWQRVLGVGMLGVFLVSGSSPVEAAMLGDLRVSSLLGQRLSASIDLDAVDARLPEAHCFRSVKPVDAETQGLPWLSRVHFKVQQQGGRSRLLLSSSETIDDPLLSLAIQVGCDIGQIREYVLLLDPPVAATSTTGSAAQDAQPAGQSATKAARPERPAPERRAKPQPAAPVASSAPRGHTWIIGEGESVASLANALYPDNPGMRKAFARGVFNANPDLALDYSSRDELPAGMVLTVPDLKKLANTPASRNASEPEVDKAPGRPATDPVPLAANPAGARPGAAQVADRLVVAQIGEGDAYPGDLVVRERIAASRQELHQLGRLIIQNRMAGQAAGQGGDSADWLALQNRLAAVQEALKQIRLAEAGQVEPVAASSSASRLMPDEPTAAGPTPQPASLPARSRAEKWQTLALGVLAGLLGALGGLWLVYRGRVHWLGWRERQDQSGLLR